MTKRNAPKRPVAAESTLRTPVKDYSGARPVPKELQRGTPVRMRLSDKARKWLKARTDAMNHIHGSPRLTMGDTIEELVRDAIEREHDDPDVSIARTAMALRAMARKLERNGL